MAHTKLTGSQAILGGATILNAPTIYAAGSYSLLTTSTTGTFKIYGVPSIEDTTTNATLGGIKQAGSANYILKIALAPASFASTNYATGYTVPAGCIIRDCWVDITTIGTSGTLTVGTATDPNGWLTGVGIQTATAVTGTLTAASETYGALFINSLCTTIAASGKVNQVATSAAQGVSVGRSATTLTATVAGNIYVEYIVPG